MLKWFRKDPVESLKKRYAALLVEARNLQRNGDVLGAAEKTAEAEAVLAELDDLESVAK